MTSNFLKTKEIGLKAFGEKDYRWVGDGNWSLKMKGYIHFSGASERDLKEVDLKLKEKPNI